MKLTDKIAELSNAERFIYLFIIPLVVLIIAYFAIPYIEGLL